MNAITKFLFFPSLLLSSSLLALEPVAEPQATQPESADVQNPQVETNQDYYQKILNLPTFQKTQQKEIRSFLKHLHQKIEEIHEVQELNEALDQVIDFSKNFKSSPDLSKLKSQFKINFKPLYLERELDTLVDEFDELEEMYDIIEEIQCLKAEVKSPDDLKKKLDQNNKDEYEDDLEERIVDISKSNIFDLSKPEEIVKKAQSLKTKIDAYYKQIFSTK